MFRGWQMSKKFNIVSVAWILRIKVKMKSRQQFSRSRVESQKSLLLPVLILLRWGLVSHCPWNTGNLPFFTIKQALVIFLPVSTPGLGLQTWACLLHESSRSALGSSRWYIRHSCRQTLPQPCFVLALFFETGCAISLADCNDILCVNK